jgi:hypothetical protein
LEELLQQYSNILPQYTYEKWVPLKCKKKIWLKSGSWDGPVVLWELYLSLSLRVDEENIGDHHKKKNVLRNCWSKKKI